MSMGVHGSSGQLISPISPNIGHLGLMEASQVKAGNAVIHM